MQLVRSSTVIAAFVLAACGNAPEGDSGDVDAAADGDGGAADGRASIIPSNSGDVGRLEPTGLVVGAGGTFDTDVGCVPTAALGHCVPSGDLCVCRADVVTLGDLDVVGTRGLAVLAWASIDVTGDVRLVAGAGVDGPGARRTDMPAAMDRVGGAGGSYGTAGAGNSAAVWGNAELVPLVGGRAGQDACGDRRGGGGGGAIQLTAGERITIGLDGGISAGGGGGMGGSYGTCAGGAGGGSGGAILVEAPRVELEGALVANGGGGGGGGGEESGGTGEGGGWSDAPARGGSDASGWGCALNGYTSGGWGGKGAAGDTAATTGGPMDTVSGCSGGPHLLGEGGDGGGLGRIRINTRTGCICTGFASPAPSRGMI